MNWLNKLDQVIDRTLQTSSSSPIQQQREETSHIVSIDDPQPLTTSQHSYTSHTGREEEGHFVNPPPPRPLDTPLKKAVVTHKIETNTRERTSPNSKLTEPNVPSAKKPKTDGNHTIPSDNRDIEQSVIRTESSLETARLDQIDQMNSASSPRDDERSEVEQTRVRIDSIISVDEASNHESSFSENGSYDSDITSSSTGDETPDFELSAPLTTPWNNPNALDPPFQNSMNCHGIVHLRILRGQRLNCAIGSTVQGVVALPPWNGRIRTEKTETYEGPPGADVCLRWDDLDQDLCYSMVHAWNNEDTPIPTITVDMMLSSLQLFESFLCSVSLSCEPLMRSPGCWNARWCPASISQTPPSRQAQVRLQKNETPNGRDDSMLPTPLILIEACFTPTTKSAERPLEQIPIVSSFDIPAVPRNPMLESDNCSYIEGTSIHDFESSRASVALTITNPTTPHMLRVIKFWSPAFCSICSRLLVGIQCYRCEVCNIDCCTDCQLQLDIQVPCGSEKAKQIVEASVQNKGTFNNIMSVVAPEHNPRETKDADNDLGTSTNVRTPRQAPLSEYPKSESDEAEALPGDSPLISEQAGIGIFKLRIGKACLFNKAFPPWTGLDEIYNKESTRDLRMGDHYVRVSCLGSAESKRTRTIQHSAKPIFATDEMEFVVPHYGMEYRVEVIEANTDKPVGTTVLTAQGLLQWQRDFMLKETGYESFSFLDAREKNTTSRPLVLELRRGTKHGFGLEFFNPGKTADATSKRTEKTQQGEISGWIELETCLVEDPDLVFSPTPRLCPPRPPDDFNVDLIQLHVSRIGAIVEDFKLGLDEYLYMISWKNPFLTGLSLFLFLRCCLRMDAEYFGSIPIFALLVYMVRLAYIRKRGRFKERFTRKAKDVRIKQDKKMSANCSVHRPFAFLDIAVPEGKNIRSRDLGIPGNVSCHVYWDPAKFMSPNLKTKMSKYDRSINTLHEIGSTNLQYSSNPVWDKANESLLSQRLKSCSLQDERDWSNEQDSLARGQGSQQPEHTRFFHFPILQPLSSSSTEVIDHDEQGKARRRNDIRLAPWDSSPGAVLIQVRFHDVISALPGFDDILGEIIVPLSRLVKEEECYGWFPLHNIGTLGASPNFVQASEKGREAASSVPPHLAVDATETAQVSTAEIPEVYLRMRLRHPHSSYHVSETDLETSLVISQEMMRSTTRAQEQGLGMIGSSISTLKTVRGLGANLQFIQNQLGAILDIIEAVRNGKPTFLTIKVLS
eukprot:scaffold59206_cov53-Attheya_sp.AAC.1